MKCPQCKIDFDDRFKFCPECGTSVSSVSQVERAARGELGDGSLEMGDKSIGELKTIQQSGDQGDAGDDQSLGDMKTIVGPGPSGGGESRIAEGELSERYEVLEEIGRGGFARVWKARDKKLGRIVAVKRLIEPAVKDANWEMTVQRFRREAQAIAGLNHRNIVGVYDVGADDEGDYLVMELVEGLSLRGYLKQKGKLEAEEAIGLIKGVGQGLGYAHKKNLVHRDIKPANVLLLKEGSELVPKIVDFGLARMGSDSELSMSGYGMGTPWYMPPEQRRNAKGVNHTADIYALGKTFYELLTGEIPDQVDADKVSPGLAKVILKCVKNAPEERFFSMEEMLGALEGSTEETKIETVNRKDQQNPCQACGVDNLPDAKFCEGCGAGLTRHCPECETENALTKVFCRGCGTDVEAFGKVAEMEERMKRYIGEKKWSRVLKEYGMLPETGKLRGEKAGGILQEVEGLAQQATKWLRDRDAANAQVKELMARGQWAEALSAVDRSLELDPGQEEIRRIKGEEIPLRWEASEWANIKQEAREQEAEGYVVEAVACVEGFLEQFPGGAHTEEAKVMCQALKENGISGIERELLKQEANGQYGEMQVFLEAGQKIDAGYSGWRAWEQKVGLKRKEFEKRVKNARRVEDLVDVEVAWSDFPGLEEKQRELIASIKRKKRLKQVMLASAVLVLLIVGGITIRGIQRSGRIRVALSEARSARDAGDWDRALLASDRALKIDSGNREAAGLKQEIVKDQRNARLSTALFEARSARDAGDWERALSASDRALNLEGSNREAAGLKREAEENLVPVLSVRAELDGRSVSATFEMGGRQYALPHRFNLEEGSRYTGTVSYTASGKQYQASGLDLQANWKGEKEHVFRMEEVKGPVAGQEWKSPSSGMEFVWIEDMNLWVGKYEVTNGEYRKKERTHSSKEFQGHSLNGDRQPVVYVNFDDAKAYAAWMTERDRASGVLPAGYRYRLPAEKEWETYAKAGKNWEYPWGNNWPPKSGEAGNYTDSKAKQSFSGWDVISGYTDGYAVTAPVEKSWANPWGLYGVGGNVWEMAAKDATNSSFGAWRGASWCVSYQDFLRCSFRSVIVGSYRGSNFGFRLVLSR
jgi:serine/threonine protein kinase/formylglycine-generating enzyme required for sulfatase activity